MTCRTLAARQFHLEEMEQQVAMQRQFRIGFNGTSACRLWNSLVTTQVKVAAADKPAQATTTANGGSQ